MEELNAAHTSPTIILKKISASARHQTLQPQQNQYPRQHRLERRQDAHQSTLTHFQEQITQSRDRLGSDIQAKQSGTAFCRKPQPNQNQHNHHTPIKKEIRTTQEYQRLRSDFQTTLKQELLFAETDA